MIATTIAAMAPSLKPAATTESLPSVYGQYWQSDPYHGAVQAQNTEPFEMEQPTPWKHGFGSQFVVQMIDPVKWYPGLHLQQ